MKNLLMCFVLALVLLPLPQRAEAITKLTWTMADTLQYPAGRRVIHAWVSADTLSGNVLMLGNFTMPNGKLLDVGRATIDTLNTFLMVPGQRAMTKYVASDTLRTDLITGLTDTNTGLSWLGADSIAVVAGGTARIVVGAGGNVYVPHRNLIVGRSTIEDWSSSFEVLQLGKNALVGTDAQLQLFQGAYQSAGGFNYTTTNAPSRYGQLLGTHTWYSAPSGSVGGGITWNTLMTLSPGGRLAVGSTDTTLAKSLFYDNTALSIPVGYFFQDNASATGAALQARHDHATGKIFSGLSGATEVYLTQVDQISGFLASTNDTLNAWGTGGGDANKIITLAPNDTLSIATSNTGAKLFTITRTNQNQGALVFADYITSTIDIVSDPNSIFIATSTPAPDRTGIFKSAGSHTIRFRHNYALKQSYAIYFLGSGPTSVTVQPFVP